MRPDGDQLLAIMAALASPPRLRIIAALKKGGRCYVSQLAREVAHQLGLLGGLDVLVRREMVRHQDDLGRIGIAPMNDHGVLVGFHWTKVWGSAECILGRKEFSEQFRNYTGSIRLSCPGHVSSGRDGS